jgi:hypothetical protein
MGRCVFINVGGLWMDGRKDAFEHEWMNLLKVMMIEQLVISRDGEHSRDERRGEKRCI